LKCCSVVGIDLTKTLKGHSIDGIDLTKTLKGHSFDGIDLTKTLKGHSIDGIDLTMPLKGHNALELLLTICTIHESLSNHITYTMFKDDHSLTEMGLICLIII